MKLSPINLENDNISIHPFRQMDFIRHDEIIKDIYSIFSEDEVVKYVPEKKMADISLAQNYMAQSVVFSYSGLQVTEFITLKKLNRVIGVVEIISPPRVQENYPDINANTWMIEYYLNKEFWGHNIMTHAVDAIIKAMFHQNVQAIGAIVRRENMSSIKLLEYNEFVWKMKYDVYQDYYECIPLF